MASTEQTRFIGFPPPLLGGRPQRLPVLGCEPGQWLALDKPADVLTERHRWYPGMPALVPALNAQAEAGKPELEPYGVTEARHVYILEPEISGVLLLALSDERLQQLREAYGSGQMRFRFGFLAQWRDGPEERSSQLPVAVHNTEPRALISHQSGKKCRTRFRLVERLGDYAWWEASATYLRPHQVRLHAAELGLPVVGDALYGGPEPICLSMLKRDYRQRGIERPLYAGLCLHLEGLEANLPGQAIRLEAGLPKGLAVLRRRLVMHA